MLTRDQVRELDRRAIHEYGVPGIVLMENAGRGVAEKIVDLGLGGPVLICCGKGNNAGDGFVIARHLELRGYDVRILCCGQRNELPPDAATNFAIVESARIPLTFLNEGEAFGPDHKSLAGART